MESAKIDPRSFGLSIGVTAALFWGIYSTSALLLLVIEVYISGFYGYTDLSNYDWKPELDEFFAALSAISLVAGLTGWLIAAFYNFLNGIFEPKLR